MSVARSVTGANRATMHGLINHHPALTMDERAQPLPPAETNAVGVTDTLTLADGQQLVRRHWALPQARRGVLIVHGLGEHSGRYAALAGWFRDRGFDVLGYDQRGHGLTPGPRGALRHDDDLLRDLAAVYADYATSFTAPPLLLGHSMGGVVAMRAVQEGLVEPAALVISSPAWRSWTSPFMRRLAGRLSRWTPNLGLSNGLALEMLSHDPAVVAAYRSDPLNHGRITPRLAHFIFEAGARCIADAPTLAVPMLLLVAGADKLVDPSGSRDFARTAPGTLLATRYFDSLYHELFNEAEPARSGVLRQLGDWLGRQQLP